MLSILAFDLKPVFLSELAHTTTSRARARWRQPRSAAVKAVQVEHINLTPRVKPLGFNFLKVKVLSSNWFHEMSICITTAWRAQCQARRALHRAAPRARLRRRLLRQQGRAGPQRCKHQDPGLIEAPSGFSNVQRCSVGRGELGMIVCLHIV